MIGSIFADDPPEYLYYADGGGTETPVRCVLGGEVKFDDETYTFSSSGCEDVTEDRPFKGFTLRTPSNIATDVTKWCPISNPYNAKTIADPATKRQQWGYCLEVDNTEIPTASPTAFDPTPKYFADGAGVGFNEPGNVDENGFQDCVFPFTYKKSNGQTVEFNECAFIDEFKPYHSTSTFPDPPADPRTDTSRWCAINSAAYDKDPSPTRLRKDWGYCLEIIDTRSPTMSPSASPSTSPSTSSPSRSPSINSTASPTRSPSESGRILTTPVPSTLSPTASPTRWTSRTVYFGVGGGLDWNESMECNFPTWIEGDNQWYDGCIDFMDAQPWMENASVPILFPEHELNVSLWCSVHNGTYDKTGTYKSEWGYCSALTELRIEGSFAPTTDSAGSRPSMKWYLGLLLLVVPIIGYFICKS